MPGKKIIRSIFQSWSCIQIFFLWLERVNFSLKILSKSQKKKFFEREQCMPRRLRQEMTEDVGVSFFSRLNLKKYIKSEL